MLSVWFSMTSAAGVIGGNVFDQLRARHQRRRQHWHLQKQQSLKGLTSTIICKIRNRTNPDRTGILTARKGFDSCTRSHHVDGADLVLSGRSFLGSTFSLLDLLFCFSLVGFAGENDLMTPFAGEEASPGESLSEMCLRCNKSRSMA